MNKFKYPKDDENICLRCKHRYLINGVRYKYPGDDYWVSFCDCQLVSIRGVNKGHRRNCKYFDQLWEGNNGKNA